MDKDKVEKVTEEMIDEWATDSRGPVALHLKQKLVPVEGEGGVIFPPTYADIGYNIDPLSDGKKVVTIDSVGSQANRMEPIFKFLKINENWLVPQISIVLHTEDCGECDACKTTKTDGKKKECTNPINVTRSLLDLAHRAGDAVVQASPTLVSDIKRAFNALHKGDAGPLCRLAPTSLVFGVWDSRGDSGEKRPRLVRSIIRAWDVEPIHAAAQFNSVWKALSEEQRTELEKYAKDEKVKLSEKGFADAPAIFRKTKIQQYLNGAPNPNARVLGGVLVNGEIRREITINLVALRGLKGKSEKETELIRKYLLGLSLVAATADIELFLREGCHLRYTGNDEWYAIPRRGNPSPIDLVSAKGVIDNYTNQMADNFRKDWPDEKIEHKFDTKKVKTLLKKETGDESSE